MGEREIYRKKTPTFKEPHGQTRAPRVDEEPLAIFNIFCDIPECDFHLQMTEVSLVIKGIHYAFS